MGRELSEKDIRTAWACATTSLARRKLLKLPKCPSGILSRVASYDGYTIAIPPTEKTTYREIALARRHPNLPVTTITSYLRKAAKAPVGSGQFGLCTDFFLNPNFPADIISTLYASPTPTYIASNLSLIVNNPACSLEILDKAFRHGDRRVAQSLAYNPALPNHLVRAILELQDPMLQGVIVRNPGISTEVIFNIFREWPKGRVSGYLLGRLISRMPESEIRREAVLLLVSSSRRAYARGIIAQYSEDPELLKDLSLDLKSHVRKATLGNPNTPEEGLVAATLLEYAL